MADSRVSDSSSVDRQPSRRLWPRVLLAVASPLVFFGAIELGLRAFHVSTALAANKNFNVAVPVWLLADPAWVRDEKTKMGQEVVKGIDIKWYGLFEPARYIGLKMRPGLDEQVVNPFNPIEAAQGSTFHVRSNSDGFRGPEFPKTAAGVARIVAVGDSSTFGFGVDDEWTYESLLEFRMRAANHPARVMNLGIPGETTRNGIGVLKHVGLALRPDVVIVSFGANDARGALKTSDEELSVDDTWMAGVRWSLMRLRTYQFIRKLLISVYDPFDRPARPAAANAAPANPPATVKAVSPSDYDANLRTLQRMAASVGAKTIFLSVCTPPDYVGEMAKTATALGVPFIDALQLFEDNIDGLIAGSVYPAEVQFYKRLYGERFKERRMYYVTTDGCHPNRAGMSLIADALERETSKLLKR